MRIFTIQLNKLPSLTRGKLINKNIDLPAHQRFHSTAERLLDIAHTIFFAIKSSHQDGNKFIEGLYTKGVRNFVVSDKNINIKNVPLANVILVTNTVDALQLLALLSSILV